MSHNTLDNTLMSHNTPHIGSTHREKIVDLELLLSAGIHEIKGDLVDIAAMVPNDLGRIHERLGNIDMRVNRLLSCMQIEMGLVHRSISPVRIGDLLDDVLSRTKMGQILDVSLIADENIADMYWPMARNLAEDVLVSALRNALRHANKKIHITIEIKRGCLNISIDDDGPGFSPEVLSEGPLIRGHGLFIASIAMQQHHYGNRKGSMEIANNVGLPGAHVRFSFPCSKTWHEGAFLEKESLS